jgi:hypothetical protein
MKVGDLVKGARHISHKYDTLSVGVIVGINPLDGRFMVKWNNMPRAYPEPRDYLELLSASR